MAAPDPLELIAEHDAQALELERAAITAAAGPLRQAARQVFSWAVSSWARLFGKPRAQASGSRFTALTAKLAARIAGIPVDAGPVLTDYATRARRLGAEQAHREAGARVRPIPLELEPTTVAAIELAVKAARAKLAEAATLVRAADSGTLADVQRRIAAMGQAAAIIEAAARDTANGELNAAMSIVAQRLDARLVWVAERDACVSCLAQAGRLIVPGGHFDWRHTFGAKSYQPKAYDAAGKLVLVELSRPPRHPRCRCRLSLWLGHDEAAALAVTHDWAEAIKDAQARGDHVAVAAARKAAAAAAASAAFDLPGALRREAERSVLRGDALPSESENVRLQAADRLLTRIGSGKNSPAPSGWRVPASVKARAERAVKRGQFTR
ncbi:hypothetical protein [Amycolatopsis sp. NBC_00438]|uniref:hypothetical protein n=1 Tax=Amycolatopsis sp. NBC_00438 TaxID=2903558 RepID=UPI002E1B2488